MSELVFSERPGAHERQLKRRYNNPLFPEHRREINQQTLDQARHKDLQEVDDFNQALQALLQQMGAFSGNEETDKVLTVKGELDRLYEQSMGLTGTHETARQGLLRLNGIIMKAIRSAAGQDALAIEELDKEQQARELHLALMEYPIVVDMLRANSPIEEDELLPSILSEDSEAIQMAVSLFDAEQRTLLDQQATELQQHLQQQHLMNADLAARFNAMLSTPQ